MKPDKRVREEYLSAFAQIVSRISQKVAGTRSGVLPIRMYVAGGAALHLTTGARVSEDIDAVFSRRLILNEDIQVSYRDADGRARLLYLDRNYNDTLGLLHQNAYRDSPPIAIPGADHGTVEVRVLAPVDLAVTKLARFSEQDRADIEIMAKEGLIDSASLRKRAKEALEGYVGDLDGVRASIDVACRLIDSMRAPKAR